MNSTSLLNRLGIGQSNPGTFAGIHGWISPSSATSLVSFNPSDGKPLATVLQGDGDVYETLMTEAQQTFVKWRTIPAPKRGELVRDLADALREKKTLLGDLVSLEMGKIQQEGHGEVQEMIDIADFAVGLSRQLYGKTMHSERYSHRMYEQWHPLGPVGVISAFNFPVAVWSWNAMIAAVCGDPVIWKPSSKTPLCAIAVQNICNPVLAAHGVPGLFSTIIGPGGQVGQRLLDDSRVPLISFTGSTGMGRHVSQTVAGRFGKTILELGGNNAIIITPSANLDMAVRAVLFGAVGTAGQRCTSTRRIIVHESVSEEFLGRLVGAYKQVKIGDPLNSETLMGPLIDKGATDVMMGAIDQAKREGGTVLVGGTRAQSVGENFVNPTIVQMPSQTPIVQTETFAPILYVLTYRSLEEAIALHNSVPQGLSSAIFTTDIRQSEAFLSAVGSDCGIANVNIGTSGAEIGGAFGGEKETGGGREAGSDAWKAYMRRQTNTCNWSSELPLAQGITFDLI